MCGRWALTRIVTVGSRRGIDGVEWVSLCVLSVQVLVATVIPGLMAFRRGGGVMSYLLGEGAHGVTALGELAGGGYLPDR